jgi:threonine synthase
MNYISTRNNQKNFTFKDVFLKGLADDGGLFVPKSIKQLKKRN